MLVPREMSVQQHAKTNWRDLCGLEPATLVRSRDQMESDFARLKMKTNSKEVPSTGIVMHTNRSFFCLHN